MTSETKIVVADDDPLIRETLESVLIDAGFQVSSAENGDQAAQLVNDVGADLLLIDIVMPGKEGLETIQELRQGNVAVKIIAMSGSGVAAGEYLRYAETFGADAIILKPFSGAELANLVDSTIAA